MYKILIVIVEPSGSHFVTPYFSYQQIIDVMAEFVGKRVILDGGTSTEIARLGHSYIDVN